MSELVLWKKQELDKLRKDLDLLFNRFRRGFGVPRSLLEAAESFSTELSETDELLVLSTDLPGIKPEDIEISVTDDTLNLKAEARQDSVDQKEDFQRIEKSYRSFSRSISLPCRIIAEDVKATYKDDILRIELPKFKPKKARGVIVDMR
ncbi:MAG: Hsp20/alpha crystallin family protein [Desulfobacterales bacterium]|jgi:HSP20 family protein